MSLKEHSHETIHIDASAGETGEERLPVNPHDISVAVLYPGNRIDKMNVPLQASRMDVEVEPTDPYSRDIVVADNADRDLGREVLRNPFHDAKLVYRMRGDVFHELTLWPMHPVKKWAATNIVLPNVDGVIAVTDRLADKFTSETGIDAGSAGLPKEPAEWPTVMHTDRELRIVTLTNTDYWQKIEALVEWAPIVNDVLESVGGRWHICGDGSNDDRLREALEPYAHVSFQGYVDASEELAASNLMIHASHLDGQPNAILEGLACGLPVVTNPFPEFLDFGWPLDVATSMRGLKHQLERYCDPSVRETRGREGTKYIEENHTPDAIARDYERYFARLLDGD